MPYTAYVTDEAYSYDGSFQGFLCCVFESYARRELPAAVLSPEEGQMTLFGTRQILTDSVRARRVAAGVERLGADVKNILYKGFLSCETGKDLVLLRFVRFCFENPDRPADQLGHEEVAAAAALARAVGNEAGKYIELMRFEQRGLMLGAVIHPRNRILPLLRRHFCSRLPDEDFLIFDATNGVAMVRQNGRVQYLAMEHYERGRDEGDLDWQALWKRFFNAVCVEERRNEKLQMNHVPKRYWQDLCEMQPEPAGRGATSAACLMSGQRRSVEESN